MQRLKIIHVINSLVPGGAEILLANTLSKSGLQQYTDNVLVYFQGSSALEQLIDPDVKIICLQYRGIRSLPALLKKLRYIILDEKADVVHTHLTPAGLYTRLALPPDVAQIHTLHTTFSIDKETRPIFKLADTYFFFARKDVNIICLSDYTKQDFLKHIHPRGRVFVLNNFVEDRYFIDGCRPKYIPGEPLSIVATGTIKPLKNYEYLIEVFSLLKEYNIHLDIYGRGDSPFMQEAIKKDGLKISFKGAVDDTSVVLGKYNLFIMPSKFEGFPLSLFEAMAMQLPALVSDIAPLRSIAHNHVLYFPLARPQKVADIILSIYKGQINIDKLAVGGRCFAETLVRKQVFLHKLLRIYEAL